jgi:hypothetical protein
MLSRRFFSRERMRTFVITGKPPVANFKVSCIAAIDRASPPARTRAVRRFR